MKFAWIALALLAVGCAGPHKHKHGHGHDHHHPHSEQQPIAEAAKAFTSAPSLTEEQKAKLTAIYTRTATEAQAIRVEIQKLKKDLFQLVATAAYDSKDVFALTKKITDLDQKRLTLMFKSLAEVQAVVGYGKGKEDLYRHFFDYEYPRMERLSSLGSN